MPDQPPALFPRPAEPEEKPHQLVLTEALPAGGIDLQVVCPGVTWRCEAWTACDRCEDPDDDTLAALESGTSVHGERHEYFDGTDYWMVPTGRCYVPDAGDLEDQVTIVTDDQPGSYLVTVQWPDDQHMRLTLVGDST